MLRKHLRSLCCLCLSLLLCGAASGAAHAQDTLQATLAYHSLTIADTVRWDFEFSDRWFETDASVYNHPIARASMGLSIASFRTNNTPPDANVLSYLAQLGFTDLVSQDYDRVPDLNTISTVIGHKQLHNGETLLVVAICGQGYENEWLSNFDIGSQEAHRGFQSSSEKVFRRIEQYMAAHQITSPRLWMSGFSRAAAVANLTGAQLMEAGLFTPENAFIYAFATPRTTREPVAYPNMFNIVGKFDPVTKLPFREWGYDRHGVTLFTPAQETDSDYRLRQAAADVPFRQLTGVPLWNDPVLNQRLSIIEAYALSNIPSADYYDSHMSAHIAAAWEQPNADAILTVLRTMASISGQVHADDPEYQHWTEDLINYLFTAAIGMETGLTGDSAPEGISDAVSVSLLLEHNPDIYLAWLYASDDPAQVYSDKTCYIQLVVGGDADVSFFDQRGGYILSVSPDGQVLEATQDEHYNRRIRPVEDRPLLTALTVSGRQIFAIPNDQGFPFTMKARSDSDLQYYALYYDVDRCAPSMSAVRSLHMSTGEEYLAFCLTERGKGVMGSDEPLWGDSHEIGRVFDADHLLSAADINQVASLNPHILSVRELFHALLAVLGVIVLALILIPLVIILHCLKKARRKKRRASAATP